MSHNFDDVQSAAIDSVPSAPEDPVPRRVGEFELLEVIGRGGMGVVHKARHQALGHLVALKFLGTEWRADSVEVGRFRREAEALSRLDHPQIVPILSFGQDEGRPYFTMPLYVGGSLDQHLANFADRPRDAARVIREASLGVHHAHQRGILHRDLKPSNILLDDQGSPRIADFGLARQVGETSELTPTGNILGSLPYASPEACLGRADEVNTLSDVYGLGSILYALLTGRSPFGSDSTAVTIERIVIDEPRPPRESRPGIPRELETICLKCLEKSQKDRYDSAAALAEDLRRYLEGYPIQGRRVGAFRRLQLWAARRPGIALFSSVATIITLVGLVVSISAFAQARRTSVILEEVSNIIMGGFIDRLDPNGPLASMGIDLAVLADQMKRAYEERFDQFPKSASLCHLIIESLRLAELADRRRGAVGPGEDGDLKAQIALIRKSLAESLPGGDLGRLPAEPLLMRTDWLLARCDVMEGEYQAALERYEEMLRHPIPRPVHFQVQREKIQVLQVMGRRDEAAELRRSLDGQIREHELKAKPARTPRVAARDESPLAPR